MSRFDPRQAVRPQTVRASRGFAGPRRALGGLAVLLVGALGWGGARLAAEASPTPFGAEDWTALEERAFASSALRAQQGVAGDARRVPVKLAAGEPLDAALRRTGLGEAEAVMAASVLKSAFQGGAVPADLSFDASVAGETGQARLLGLAVRTGPVTAVTLSRSHDGSLRLRETVEPVRDEVAVAAGRMDGSLLRAAAAAGADAKITGELVRLLGHQVDFGRDIETGDPFRLVYDRRVTDSGRVVETGGLLYGELEIRGRRVSFYRFDHDGRSDWFNAAGKSLKGELLRTPLDGARVTSNYGMRMHPILGYSRMHQGIDFGAATGTPVYAAGDGVVVEAKVWGGYGNWLRIRHQGGWETGYGHLSAYAAGLKPGQTVRQGEVVAYVGSTGASTGPHLHFETWRDGARMDPRNVRVPGGTVLSGAQLVAFRAQRALVDSALAAHAAEHLAPTTQAALRGKVSVTG